MNKSIATLLSIASDPIGPEFRSGDESILAPFEGLGRELKSILQEKNGFFAFESALHVLPVGGSSDFLQLASWNDPASWRAEYGDLLQPGMLFFAQDIFGNQFGMTPQGVFALAAETAELQFLGDTLDQWADELMSNWKPMTGFQLGHDWQMDRGPLQEGQRLIPRLPFVIGSPHDVSNLYAGNAVEAMRFRGSLARQIADLPDGTSVKLEII